VIERTAQTGAGSAPAGVHLSLVGRSGFMTQAESEKGIRLFSKEVLPRLREIKSVTAD